MRIDTELRIDITVHRIDTGETVHLPGHVTHARNVKDVVADTKNALRKAGHVGRFHIAISQPNEYFHTVDVRVFQNDVQRLEPALPCTVVVREKKTGERVYTRNERWKSLNLLLADLKDSMRNQGTYIATITQDTGYHKEIPFLVGIAVRSSVRRLRK